MKNHIKKFLSLKIAAIIAILTTVGILAQPYLVNTDSIISSTWNSITAVTGTFNNLVVDGSPITAILSTNVSVDFAACGTNATVIVTQTVTGATTNDVAIANFSTPHTSFVYGAAVTAANTVTLRAANISITNNIDQAAMPVRISVIQY